VVVSDFIPANTSCCNRSTTIICNVSTSSCRCFCYIRNIAGLFSVLNHVKYNGIEISAADIRKTFDTYNPGFEQEYADIYSSLERVNVMINDDGIISVKTEDGKSVVFDKLKINDGAQLNITSFESGDAQINILSGCVVGKMMIWFDTKYFVR